MKLISFLALLLVLISCGKNTQSGSSDHQKENESDISRQNGYVDASRESIPELLNVTGVAMIEKSGDRIMFKQPITVRNQGSRISCGIAVLSGAIWHIRESGKTMELELSQGKRLILKRLGGSWLWRGKENQSEIIRRYTFLPDRLVINQDCEG